MAEECHGAAVRSSINCIIGADPKRNGEKRCSSAVESHRARDNQKAAENSVSRH